MIISTVPGKKKLKKLSPPGTPGAANDRPIPPPMSSQKTTGVSSAPTTRLRGAQNAPVPATPEKTQAAASSFVRLVR